MQMDLTNQKSICILFTRITLKIMKNFKFNLGYASACLILLSIEILIAVYHFNPFIRGFVGDVLVVIFLFTLIKTFYNYNSKKLAFGILVFAFFVEMFQYFKLADVLEIKSTVVRIIIGTAFEATDLLAYSIGFFLVLLFEFQFLRNEHS